jgi:hypothetical protein
MQRVDHVDPRVWAAVADWLAQPDLVSRFLEERGGRASEAGQQALADLNDWQTKLESLPALEAEALRLREKGLLSAPALETRLGELQRRRQALERQVETARAMAHGAQLETVDVMELEGTLADLRGRCAEATPEQRRELVKLLCPDGWTVSATVIEAEAVFCPGVGSGTAKTMPGQNARASGAPTTILRV